MHKRSTALRFAVAATVLALAAPVWATEIQMKKKEDPKAQKAAKAEEQKAGESSQAGDKKNCPENKFNTLEDLFGAAGPLDPVTGLPTLPAAQPQLAASPQAAAQASQAKGPVAAAQPAAPAVEWRAVQATDKTAKPEPKPEAKAQSEEKKKD